MGIPYRLPRFNNAFDGKPKERGEPLVIRDMEYQQWVGEGNQPKSTNDPSTIHGVNWCSILYDLPYFKVHIMLTILVKSFFRIVSRCCNIVGY
jgi:hypothetical protein